MAAFEVFNNRRQNWGYTRFWKGDYLALVEEHENHTIVSNYKDGLSTLRQSHPFGKVLFSTYIQVWAFPKIDFKKLLLSLQKFNRFNKTAHRVLLVTDRYVAKLDAKKFKLLKEPVLLTNVGDERFREKSTSSI